MNTALLFGCARSGTSIFAEAIAAHPAVKYVFEPHRISEQAGSTGVERCALVWRDVVRTACADLAGVTHLRVHYEALLAAPRETVAQAWRFLGLPPDDRAAAYADRIQDATAGSFHAAKQVAWYRDDHARRHGRWRENLTPEQQTRVNALLADTLNALGYE